jgi:hypothetical protein
MTRRLFPLRRQTCVIIRAPHAPCPFHSRPEWFELPHPPPNPLVMPKTGMTITQTPILSHRFQSIVFSAGWDIFCLCAELSQRSVEKSLRYKSRCPVEKKVTNLRKNAAPLIFAH